MGAGGCCGPRSKRVLSFLRVAKASARTEIFPIFGGKIDESLGETEEEGVESGWDPGDGLGHILEKALYSPSLGWGGGGALERATL